MIVWVSVVLNRTTVDDSHYFVFSSLFNYSEKFEPRNHFRSRWNMIFQVSVGLNKTVVDND